MGVGVPVARRQVWLVSLEDLAIGHEQAMTRPALVISDDIYNNGPSGMLIVLFITTKDKGIPFHIPVGPGEGGLKKKSFVMCDQIRSISRKRLVGLWGTVGRDTMAGVEEAVKALIFPPV